jgi:hypothetical protein
MRSHKASQGGLARRPYQGPYRHRLLGMEGDSRGTNNRILGARPPVLPYISQESPSMHNSLSSNFKLLQAGSTGLTRAMHSGKFDADTVNATM